MNKHHVKIQGVPYQIITSTWVFSCKTTRNPCTFYVFNSEFLSVACSPPLLLISMKQANNSFKVWFWNF